MTLTYSRHQPSGTVLVWQQKHGELTSVYADLSGSGGSFDEKVKKAREIVSAVNHARRPSNARWVNTDYPPSFRPEENATDEELNEALNSVPYEDANGDWWEAGGGAMGPSPLDKRGS